MISRHFVFSPLNTQLLLSVTASFSFPCSSQVQQKRLPNIPSAIPLCFSFLSVALSLFNSALASECLKNEK